MTAATVPARSGSRAMEWGAWLGMACGLLCCAASASTMLDPPVRLYAAAGLPTPDQITAYATAICGALLTVANTLYIVWHKLHEGPRGPRKPRRKRPDATRPPRPAP